MYKIYESNNYIIVEGIDPKEMFYGHKKEVFIDKSNLDSPIYSVFNVKDFEDGTTMIIGEIQKQDGSLYTEEEFDTFYTLNTGNFNRGGTAPTQGVVSVSGRNGVVALTKVDVGLANVDNTSDLAKPISTSTQNELNSKVNSILLAVSSGVATLGVDAKLTASQIPDSLLSGLKWQGAWNVSTNTPAIPAASVGNNGFFYKVSVGGTSSITGSSVTFGVSDWLISNGISWQRVPNADAIASVNGQTGVVNLNATNVGAVSLTNFISKGVLISGATAVNTSAITTLGNNGQILSVDPSAPGGIKWIDQTPVAVGFNAGDTKFSYITLDHSGWYVLDGRSVSSLSPTAQAAATTLGWVSNVPDTRGKFSLAASATVGSGTNGGSNTIARANLPNVTLSGNTGTESQSHTHTTASYTIADTTDSEYATNSVYPNVASFSGTQTVRSEDGAFLAGTDLSYMTLLNSGKTLDNDSTYHNHDITINVPTKTSGVASATHTHAFTTSSINDNVTQTAFVPSYSAKTEFVFLGL
jgi:hypothetical protein